MLRMRHVGRCLVLLLLGCCGLLAHVTISDYNMPDQNGSGDVTGDFGGSFGVGIGHGGVIPVSKIMKMHMQPVPLREFHARLRTIRNKFDFLRIFLADQDMTDDSLRSLFSASVLSPSTDNLMHTDFSQPAQLSVGTPAPLTSSTAQHDLTSADDTLIPTEKNDPVSSRNVAKEEGGLVRLLTSKSMLTSAIGSKEDSNRDAGVSKLASSRSHPALSQTEHLSHEDTILHKLKIPVANIDILDRDLDNAEVKKEGDIALSGKGSYSKVEKRAEEWYEDYSVEDLDGNVDYFNDEQHPDAFMEELEEAVYHITEMENNPQARCHDPQPTVVYIEDPKKLKRQFYPECTVVHRCRQDGGCCGRNSECGPKTEQVIMRSFLVVNVDPTSDTVMPDSEMVERIALVNHTECECREKKPVPKCNQSCPGVFRMRRYGAQCVCDCDSVPNERFPQCDGVKDGLYPLSQADLVCIKSGSCGLPKCSVGTFDVQSGLCPLNDAPTFAGHLQQQLYERHQQRQRRRPTVVEGSGDF